MADVRYTAEELKKIQDQTDWEKLLSMKDEDIVCDDDAPDLAGLMKKGSARILKRGPLSDTTESYLKKAL